MYGNKRPRRDSEGFSGGGFSRGGFRSPVNVGEELDVEIESVGEKGDGVAKKQGFVIFVPGVQKGDKVKIKINKVFKKMAFAEVVGQSQGGEEPQKESSPETEEEPQEESKEESSEEESQEDGDEESDEESDENTEDFGEEK